MDFPSYLGSASFKAISVVLWPQGCGEQQAYLSLVGGLAE